MQQFEHLPNAFQGEEHQPFVLPCDGSNAAALLVHGFPGTPAEMRGLAHALHRAGWTVEALLLPGFGAQIEMLGQRNHGEWVVAARDAVVSLRERYQQVLLVGFSMGAAVSIKVAADFPHLDGLILLAPFWQLGETWQQAVWPLLRLFVREFKPFEKADFSNPQTRRDLKNFLPDADLDNPAMQNQIRRIGVPMRLLEELRLIGRAAYAHAPRVETPTLIVQGRDDTIARPDRTRRLLKRFTFAAGYEELAGDHQMVLPDNPAWPSVEALVLQFAAPLLSAKVPQTHERAAPPRADNSTAMTK